VQNLHCKRWKNCSNWN